LRTRIYFLLKVIFIPNLTGFMGFLSKGSKLPSVREAAGELLETLEGGASVVLLSAGVTPPPDVDAPCSASCGGRLDGSDWPPSCSDIYQNGSEETDK
jgi:hypothetical protein